MEFYELWKQNPSKAHKIVNRYRAYLKKQKDITFTLDALRCQEKTIKPIKKCKKHESRYFKKEKNRGRIEKRTVSVYKNNLSGENRKKRKSVNSIIEIRRVAVSKGKTNEISPLIFFAAVVMIAFKKLLKNAPIMLRL